MVNPFSFGFNRSLIAGEGAVVEIAKYLPSETGRLGLVAAPSFIKSGQGKAYLKRLEEAGFSVKFCLVHGEPSPETVNSVTDELSSFDPAVIVAVGGGSVIDAGKAVSAMLPVNGRIEDYLEGVGTLKPGGQKIPFIAVPTTSGTGSEATMNAVISRPGPEGFKKSIRHFNYIPDVAVLDPLLTVTCPAGVTASCGMDAFSQLLESYLSTAASPVSEIMALDGLKRFLSSFDMLMEDLSNTSLRMNLSLSAYFSGLNLANVDLGIVHGLAGPIGGFSSMNHGSACGTLLYDAFRMTVEKISPEQKSVLDKGDSGSVAFHKMAGLGHFIAGKTLPDDEACSVLLEKLKSWGEKYKMPRLGDFNLSENDLDKVAAAGKSRNHPVVFSREEMAALLRCRL